MANVHSKNFKLKRNPLHQKRCEDNKRVSESNNIAKTGHKGSCDNHQVLLFISSTQPVATV